MNSTNIFGGSITDPTPDNVVELGNDPNITLGTPPEQPEQPRQSEQAVSSQSEGAAVIVLSPEKKDQALAKGTTIVGRDKFVLPDTEGQLAGFEVAHAGSFVAQFPQYKFKVGKGTVTPSVTI